MSKVQVTFRNKWRAYNGGETASFMPNIAAQLIRDKFAVPFGEKAEVVKKEAEAEAEAVTATEVPEGEAEETPKPKRSRSRDRR